MPTLKYWDVTSGQYIAITPVGPTYANVAATAPNAAAPVINPPNGFLWVDTSTTASFVATPYYPPQTPPASGFNSFTDSGGEVWVSLNGSAWKKARDGLHAFYYRNAAYTLVVGTVTALPYDTRANDTYGLYNASTARMTFPVTGWWSIHTQMNVNFTAAGQYGQTLLQYISGGGGPGNYANSVIGTSGAAVWSSIESTYTAFFGSGNQLETDALASAALPVNSGPANSFLTIDYLGTG
jgi:hypothetical protein